MWQSCLAHLFLKALSSTVTLKLCCIINILLINASFAQVQQMQVVLGRWICVLFVRTLLNKLYPTVKTHVYLSIDPFCYGAHTSFPRALWHKTPEDIVSSPQFHKASCNHICFCQRVQFISSSLHFLNTGHLIIETWQPYSIAFSVVNACKWTNLNIQFLFDSHSEHVERSVSSVSEE